MPTLTQYIQGVLVKKVSGGEAGKGRCHQHEFNGIGSMKAAFGTDDQKIQTTFLYLDDDGEAVSAKGTLTWYDSRRNQPHRSAEYRLFYSTNPATERMKEGDTLFLGFLPDRSAMVILAPADSTINSQLHWLFGIAKEGTYQPSVDRPLEWVSRTILEQIGIETHEESDSWLDILLEKFPNGFPSTREFSQFARDTLTEVDVLDNPDCVLLAWLEREEALFKTLENHLVKDRIQKGFQTTDEFIEYSLSVHNRRKSRVGHALENHFESLLIGRHIRYSCNAITENKSRPDFLFPTIEDYKNPEFPATRLTLLGAKSTCKDRWRQVLAEADRIEHKHLLTLEAAISTTQTQEMQQKNLQLVIPKAIHTTYTETQQMWLMSVSSFLDLLIERDPKGVRVFGRAGAGKTSLTN